MPYCSSCGVSVKTDASFCSGCGEELKLVAEEYPESSVPSHEDQYTNERISISTGRGSNRVYNLDNVSYYQKLNSHYSLVAKVVLALLAGSLIWITYTSNSLWPVGILVAMVLLLWYYIRIQNALVIGTLASRDLIETDSTERVEAEFVEKTPEKISIRGTILGRLFNLEYQYHFVKQNIVSIERTADLFSLKPVILFLTGIAVIVSSIIVGQVPTDLTESTLRLAIYLSLIGGIILLIGTLLVARKIPTLLSVTERKIWRLGAALTVFNVLIILGGAGQLLGVLERMAGPTAPIGLGMTPMEIYANEASFAGLFLIVWAIPVLILAVFIPRAGVLISLPNEERSRFEMTQEDAEEVVSAFTSDQSADPASIHHRL